MLDRPVHPAAAVFPMLPEDELRELAEDIKANGLLHPIVLDREERIIDGRNRYAACPLAGVEPTFITYDGDPLGYVLSANLRRRHMTVGQRAMATVEAVFSEKTEIGRDERAVLAVHARASASRIDYALVIRRHAPDLVENVLSGAKTLNDAYADARKRKDAASSLDAQLGTLRAEAPDLAVLVVEERLTVRDALMLLDKRRVEARRRREAATAGLLSAMRFLAPPSGDIAEHAERLLAHLDPSLVPGAEGVTPAAVKRAIAFLEVVRVGLDEQEEAHGRTQAEPVSS